ncbi:MAG: 2-oxo acid dehydrogenase subunit E2 [Gammaproteobacteria bacterium]|nr:2-oxo acid dehydrogenase subunit E2 [Gammaproteobacteria bacterium]MBP9728799.1 2-oxo acid dehydrogenase subunit E2 [Gammaproteobacteria bacterium]
MLKEILVPDIGAYTNVSVIEVFVKNGDTIAIDEGLITLETDKATLEIPAPMAGVIKKLHLKVGDKVSQGSLILSLESIGAENTPSIEKTEPVKKNPEKSPAAAAPVGAGFSAGPVPVPVASAHSHAVHAGPGVRQLARELGIDLTQIQGTGPKGRIAKEDIKALLGAGSASAGMNSSGSLGGLSIAPWPTVDYAAFGPIVAEPLSRIQQLSGSYLQRNALMVPHVTQFDEADITELEAFRKAQQPAAEQQGVKLTLIVLVMKALVSALKAFPRFNASLDMQRSTLILKQYYHMGVAVDTPAGLVVPVLRDVDRKGLFELAKELAVLSQKAREGQLKGQDLTGSSFTISSLGGVGGTAFTPIINVPDVAILGLSKAQIKPVYKEGSFEPRLCLPLSLSYDHRVIDGAMAARFTTFLSAHLADLKRCLL